MITNTGQSEVPATVAAVIVSYFPKGDDIGPLLAAITPQVARVIVVDNTPGNACLPTVGPNVEVVRNGANLGLGAGQNVGIARARQHGVTHVLLFDQDSEPAPGMVQSLLDALRELTRRGSRVGAVGPRWLDRRTRQASPFIRVGWTGLRHVHGEWDREGFIEADFLIASGSLIPLAVIDEVGLMDESLFIDHVDIEWAFRAASRGYRMYGIQSAVLLHGLGDAKRRVWLGTWWQVPVHSPIRNYYFARNTLLVDRRPYVGWRWRVSSCLRLAALALCFVTQVPPRMARARAILAGLRDGVLGRSGAAPA